MMSCTPSHSSRPFYFGSNFKMHKTTAEVRAFVAFLKETAAVYPGVQLFILPPFTTLGGLVDIPRPANVWIGAQDMHWADSGAYTGAISAPMLRDVGADLVMVGHAERRVLFYDTDQDLNKKILNALRHDLRVLLCVGETAEQRGYGTTEETLATQLRIDLHGFDPRALDRLMIAYEPVWAIGEGSQEATPAEIEPAVQFIRGRLVALFGEAGQTIPILYGGSVNAQNCMPYIHSTSVDGLFVGRAAWQPEGFLSVLKAALSARQTVTS